MKLSTVYSPVTKEGKRYACEKKGATQAASGDSLHPLPGREAFRTQTIRKLAQLLTRTEKSRVYADNRLKHKMSSSTQFMKSERFRYTLLTFRSFIFLL